MSEFVKDYEVMLLFSSEIGEEEVRKEVESVKKEISSGNGKVTFEDFWGKRKLAYLVEKQSHGFYVVLNFQATPDFIAVFEKELRINKRLLRYLLITTPKGYQPITSGEVEGSEERHFTEWRAKKASGRRGPRPAEPIRSAPPPVEIERDAPKESADERAKKLDKILSSDLKI